MAVVTQLALLLGCVLQSFSSPFFPVAHHSPDHPSLRLSPFLPPSQYHHFHHLLISEEAATLRCLFSTQVLPLAPNSLALRSFHFLAC